MSTLKELFDKHGSVWLAYKVNPNIKAFKPIAYSERFDYEIIGETYFYNTPATSFVKSYEDLILYEEPKPKVKRYLYAVTPDKNKTSLRCIPKITIEYFKDEEELKDYYHNSHEFAKIERLDSTMQEFDW